MKKINFIRIIGCIIGVGVVVFSLGNNLGNNDKAVLKDEHISRRFNSAISMMYETESGSGIYEEGSSNTWNNDEYVFNETLSKCENGSTLSWVDGKVKMVGNVSDKCYVYFDVQSYYHNTCTSGLLACEIAKKFTGIQGQNNMYFHKSSLENGAGDNSYRYAGPNYILTDKGSSKYTNLDDKNSSSNGLIKFSCKDDESRSYIDSNCFPDSNKYYYLEYDSKKIEYSNYLDAIKKAKEDGYVVNVVNNYVCFGSYLSTCPYDNLYRIIGVFGDQVKLIKADYVKSTELGNNGSFIQAYGTYLTYNSYKGKNSQLEIGGYDWNNSDGTNSKNTWSTSNLKEINLNTNFLNTFDSNWQSKIAMTNWQVGGNAYENILEQNAKNAYQNEIVNPYYKPVVNKKIGLLYVSDYAFAAVPSAWNTKLYTDYINVTSQNWMYMGLDEWYITPRRDSYDKSVFNISSRGYILGSSSVVSNPYAIRPVFYLNSNVTLAGGAGTIDSPYIIS